MKQRFKSEAEIVELIDRYRQEIVEKNRDAADMEHLCVALRDTFEAFRIPIIRTDIGKLAHEVAWREGRLETLKEVLAEFQTTPMPGVIDDASVAAA